MNHSGMNHSGMNHSGMNQPLKTIRAAMVGLGTVNCNLLQILSDKREKLRRDFHIEFQIVAVADSRGVAVDAEGFGYETIIALKKSGKSTADLSGFLKGSSIVDQIEPMGCDLVFEASPVNLKTGGIGLEVCRKALGAGISVVLANKAPLVLAFDELTTLAAETNAGLNYSATVCGGLPILNIGKRDLIAGEITKLLGIFNGTSNFILDSMTKGKSFDEALKEAQDIGAAEADPSLDIGGWDTANKLLIIANTIMGAGITLDDITVEGIEGIDADYLIKEQSQGNVVKLVATAENGKYAVRPIAVPKAEFLASCTGWEMAVEIHTDIYGINYHKLWEREPVPTAASMLRDALHIFKN